MKFIIKGRKTIFAEVEYFEFDNITRVLEITTKTGKVLSFDVDPEPAEAFRSRYLCHSTDCLTLDIENDVVVNIDIHNTSRV